MIPATTPFDVIPAKSYLFFLCTVFMPFFAGGINLLYIGVTVVCLTYYFTYKSIEFVQLKLPLEPVVLFLYILVSSLYNLSSFRLSSIIYSGFFLLSFTFIYPFLCRYLTGHEYKRIIKYIVWAFFVTMIVQQMLFIVGLPIINLNPLFSEEYFNSLSVFRLTSLSSEPSIGSVIVVILGYSYWRASEQRFTEKLSFWLPAVYLWIFFGSSLGYIMGLLFIFKVLPSRIKLIAAISIVLLLILIVQFVDFSPLYRIINITQAVINKNSLEDILYIDASAALRFIPTVMLFIDLNLLDPHFYFGHGLDYASLFFSDLPSIVEKFSGGFMPLFIYDYGFIGFLIVIFFVRKYAVKSFFSFEFLFFILVCTNANINTQMFWIIIVFWSLNKSKLSVAKPIENSFTPLQLKSI